MTPGSADIGDNEHFACWAQLEVLFSSLHDISVPYIALVDVRVLLRDTVYGKAAPVQVTLETVVDMREDLPLTRVHTWLRGSLPCMHQATMSGTGSLYYPCVALGWAALEASWGERPKLKGLQTQTSKPAHRCTWGKADN